MNAKTETLNHTDKDARRATYQRHDRKQDHATAGYPGSRRRNEYGADSPFSDLPRNRRAALGDPELSEARRFRTVLATKVGETAVSHDVISHVKTAEDLGDTALMHTTEYAQEHDDYEPDMSRDEDAQEFLDALRGGSGQHADPYEGPDPNADHGDYPLHGMHITDRP